MTLSVVVGLVNRSIYIALKATNFVFNWFFFILQIQPSFLQFNLVCGWLDMTLI